MKIECQFCPNFPGTAVSETCSVITAIKPKSELTLVHQHKEHGRPTAKLPPSSLRRFRLAGDGRRHLAGGALSLRLLAAPPLPLPPRVSPKLSPLLVYSCCAVLYRTEPRCLGVLGL